MTRTPLRPLARILRAREAGENPDAIERENIRQRHEEMRDRSRFRAEGRLLVLGLFFFCAFVLVSARMGLMASSEPIEPRTAASSASILAQRADIVDRNGSILASNLETYSLYAQPPHIIEKAKVIAELVRIFPDLDAARLERQFSGKRKFVWIKKKISPEQRQAVHDIGDPGLQFGPREMRLYPNGKLASHMLGGASFGREGVQSAEVIGVAGVEKHFDDMLRDPGMDGAPLQLSIDLTIQAASERVLYGGMKVMNAVGAASVLMDIHTGEVISMVSLPDFDPNNRPRPLTDGDAADSPLFNRAVQGVYELGSTFKLFTIAQAIETRLVNPSTLIDTTSPLIWGKYKIRDFSKHDPEMPVSEVLVQSSNVGTARIAQAIGAKRQKEFLSALGFFAPTPLEMIEATGGKPLLPPKWSEISTMTVSYGHGISTSPVHLAAGYASMVNGGTVIKPTLLKQSAPQNGARIISQQTSDMVLGMLRKVVTEGTASFGEVEGYSVGGKTGTADKAKPTGGYYNDRVIATFASVFPTDKPKYVLIVTLDEPVENSGAKPRRTAGWTAVPVAAEMIRRVAPLLGLRPDVDSAERTGVTEVQN